MLQEILDPSKQYVEAYLVHFLDKEPTLAIYCPNDKMLSSDRASLDFIPSSVRPGASIPTRGLPESRPYVRTPFVVEYEWGSGNPVHSFDTDSTNIQRAEGLVVESNELTKLFLSTDVIAKMHDAGTKYRVDLDFFEGAGRIMAPYCKPKSDRKFGVEAHLFLRSAFVYLSKAEHVVSDADVPAPTETLDDMVM